MQHSEILNDDDIASLWGTHILCSVLVNYVTYRDIPCAFISKLYKWLLLQKIYTVETNETFSIMVQPITSVWVNLKMCFFKNTQQAL